jgi:hypothetical protein
MLNQAQKKFIDLLSKVDYSKRLYEVFYDFCTLGTYSLALPFLRDIAEPELKKAHEKYTREQLLIFDEAFTVMVNDMEISNCDFLGEVFQECEFGNERQGQFFTPFPVSLMIAKMTFTGVKEQIDRQGYITVNEPACGSGGMLIAMRQVLIEEQCNPSRGVFVVAQDISDIAFLMCYIQVSLYGLAGKVIHGNTITMEVFRVLHTPVCFLTDWPMRLAMKQILEVPEKSTERTGDVKEENDETQLNLF